MLVTNLASFKGWCCMKNSYEIRLFSSHQVYITLNIKSHIALNGDCWTMLLPSPSYSKPPKATNQQLGEKSIWLVSCRACIFLSDNALERHFNMPTQKHLYSKNCYHIQYQVKRLKRQKVLSRLNFKDKRH